MAAGTKQQAAASAAAWRGRGGALMLPVALLAASLLAAAAMGAGGQRSGEAARLRVAVCVVGQVARLETATKLTNLIQTNIAEGVDMDVFLVLQSGEARFTNTPHLACQVAPKSVKDAAAIFGKVTHTNIVPHEFGDYALPAEKWAHYPEKGQQRVQRLTNHLNQYLSWKRCARAVADAELGNGGPYDAVLRMRDNGLVLRPFHLRRMLAMQVFESATRFGRPKPQAVTHEHVRVLPVLVKMCSGWGGLNDKTMLVPRLRMNAALSGPADEFFLIPKGENRTAPKEPMKVNNPETYLKYVMGKLKVPVRRVRNPDDFPITDGRCEKGKLFCLVHHAKDCRPRSSVDIPDCKEDYFKKNV
mmetsp:Transcript_35713/g.91168  ORF Transcript_35713/g.91168 Transcript_35713/m.91168 type:complete len:359 (+) Transcript_35713:57-1133(+)